MSSVSLFTVKQLQEDIAEFKTLRDSAKRDHCKQILTDHIKVCELEVEKKLKEAARKEKLANGVKSTGTKTTIRNYAFDQSDKFMKLYITVTGLKSSDTEKVKCSFTENSLDLYAEDDKKVINHLYINNLARNIVPEKSYTKVKDDMVVVFMLKGKMGEKWLAVTAQEVKLKEIKESKAPKPGMEDPSAGMMGLMKQMYEDGDDGMKQIINKAMYESQNKVGGGGANDPGMGLGMPDLKL